MRVFLLCSACDPTTADQFAVELLPKNDCFAPYPAAVEALGREFDPSSSKCYFEFKQRLDMCPSGLAFFDDYESLGLRSGNTYFDGKLGKAANVAIFSTRIRPF